MKKVIYSILFLLIGGKAFSQQAPYFTHFMYNRLYYNPAVAGADGDFSTTVLYHRQWSGFAGANPPITQSLVSGLPIGMHQGIGLTIVNDNIAYEHNLEFALSYNYQFKLSVNSTLSIGPKLGLFQRSLDGSKYHPEVANDPSVPVNTVSDMKPNAGFGAYYMSKSKFKQYLGVSIDNMLENKFSYSVPGGTIDYLDKHTLYIIGGFAKPLNDNLTLLPNILVKNNSNVWQADINANLLIRNRFTIGASFRSDDAVSVLAGLYLANGLKIGYSYDMTTTALNNVSNGTHEIMLRYDLGFRHAPAAVIPKISPRYF